MNLEKKVKNDGENTTSGITLIALVVTIMLLFVLTGITIVYVFGDNGILKLAKYSNEKNSEAQAREKLEQVLIDIYAKKKNEENYEEKLEEILSNNNMTIEGNVVIIDKWKFEIDRTIPQIVANLGKDDSQSNSMIPTITSSKETVTLNKRESKKLEYELTLPEGFSEEDIIWESSNDEIVSVKDGIVTSKENGIVTITVKLLTENRILGECEIEVAIERTNLFLVGEDTSGFGGEWKIADFGEKSNGSFSKTNPNYLEILGRYCYSDNFCVGKEELVDLTPYSSFNAIVEVVGVCSGASPWRNTNVQLRDEKGKAITEYSKAIRAKNDFATDRGREKITLDLTGLTNKKTYLVFNSNSYILRVYEAWLE